MPHAGAVLLTASDGPSVNGLFLMFVIVQAIYGVGVGGEYPVVGLAYTLPTDKALKPEFQVSV